MQTVFFSFLPLGIQSTDDDVGDVCWFIKRLISTWVFAHVSSSIFVEAFVSFSKEAYCFIKLSRDSWLSFSLSASVHKQVYGLSFSFSLVVGVIRECHVPGLPRAFEQALRLGLKD